MDRRICVTLALLVSAVASAQDEEDVPEPLPEIDDEAFLEAYEQALEAVLAEPPVRVVDLRPPRNAVSFGAGVLGFVGEDGLEATRLEPAATFRYTYMPPGPFGWEVAYVGAAEFDPDDLTRLILLIETAVKLSGVPASRVSPIATAGIGYGTFAGPEASDLATTTFPLAVGIETVTADLLVSARAVWRPTFFDEDVLQFTELGTDTWGIQADIGARF